ncbi:hypothetical protein [Streptacidiphilus jiangxiensis]|uniref:Peptide zinc metalloprotease protein n=1 Tax=Streptacidiphilus jiangxiensis TaxID=235985 RepID=A0A1H7N0N2_STRJI|nr:hypothetical protein [Streptacidiphilus jiangxiensis]SEL16515.1 hypothetical protein SAMN05414137_106138 [Streptacidiphilus jiangxiensis]
MPDPTQSAEAAVPEQRLAFQRLTFLPEGDEVTVGVPDRDTYVVLPADGAALLRRLAEGSSCAAAAQWYLEEYGEPVDVADFVADLDELGFLRAPGEDEGHGGPDEARQDVPVRWRRLGRAVFSPVGAVLYLALVAAWVAAMVRTPALVPNYHHLFFTRYLSVVMVSMFVAQMPLVLLHEAAHALAGRRLGLHSRLSIGRRLHYLVFLTTLDGLVSVPRRKRFLPILAGVLTDVAVLAALTLVAAVTRRGDGSLPLVGAVALAMAYLTVLRLLWQCWFFLQTDVYFLVVTVLGCVDLQTTAKQMLGDRCRALWGRAPRHDPERWHPRDRRVARWYSLMIVAGYGFLLGTLAYGLVPTAYKVFATVVDRLSGHGGGGTAAITDSALVLLLSIGEIAVAFGLYLRERRARRRTD